MKNLYALLVLMVIGLHTIAEPLNDSCVNAIVLTPGVNCTPVTGSTNGSVLENDPWYYQTYDVWYKFTATASTHFLKVEPTSGSSVSNIVVGVFSMDCATLDVHYPTYWIDNNYGQGTGEIQLLENLTIGQEYLVRVWNPYYYGTGDFTICVSDPPVANDLCSSAVMLSVNNTCSPTPGTTIDATPGYYQDVWYKVVVTQPILKVKAVPTSPNPLDDIRLFAYSGNNCGNLLYIGYANSTNGANAESLILENLTVGDTLFIAVGVNGSSSQQGNFEICVTDNVNNGEVCSNAISLSSNATCLPTVGSTVGYSPINSPDVWYKIPMSSELMVHLFPASSNGLYDPAFDLYSGATSNSCNALNYLGVVNKLYTGEPEESGIDISSTNTDSFLYIRVYSGNTNPSYPEGDFSICVTPPVVNNDLCVNAIPILPDSNCVFTLGNTNGASGTTFLGYYDLNEWTDVWYKFPVTKTKHKILLTPTGSDPIYNADFEVFSGTCGNFNLMLSGNVTCCNSPESNVLENLTIGDTLYIRVSNYRGYFGVNYQNEGEFNLCISDVNFPNDVLSDATELMQNTSCVSTAGTTIGATPSNEADVWHKVGITSPVMTVNIYPTGAVPIFDPHFTMSYASSPNSQYAYVNDFPGYGEEIRTFENLNVGDTMYIRVYGIGTGDFNICISQPSVPNDLCSNAITLNSDTVCNYVSGTTTNATPTFWYYWYTWGAHDVWYKFTATHSVHQIHVNPTGTNPISDPVMELYAGNNCNALGGIALVNNAGPGMTENYVMENLTVGETYYVRVFSTSPVDFGWANQYAGDFEICVTNIFTANDLCSGATLLTPGNTCTPYLDSMLYATNYDLWYKFPVVHSTERIILQPMNFSNSQMTVYTGTCGSMNSLVTKYNYNGVPDVAVLDNLTIGDTLYIQVYDYNYNSSNDRFTICVSDPLPNDIAVNAIPLTLDTVCNPIQGSNYGSVSNFGYYQGGGDVFYTFKPTGGNNTVILTPDAVNGITNPIMDYYVWSGSNWNYYSSSYYSNTFMAGGLNPSDSVLISVTSSSYNYYNSMPGGFSICVTSDMSTWYQDADGDGYPNPYVTLLQATQPIGYLSYTGWWNYDCNDTNAAINPGALEICDGIDNNCNNAVDEGSAQWWYEDADADGYGNPYSYTYTCSPPSGYVLDGSDCNDNDSLNHQNFLYYYDNDGDTYGNPNYAQWFCLSSAPAGWTANNQDCDDYNAQITVANQTYYQDNDGDGLGNPSVSMTACAPPSGYVTNNNDCNDAVPTICNNLSATDSMVVVYQNDFSFNSFGNASLVECGGPYTNISAGVLNLLNASVYGHDPEVIIPPINAHSNNYHVQFDLTMNNASADGFSYSFGQNVNNNPCAYSNEFGLWNDVKIGFVVWPYNTSPGIHLWYGGTQIDYVNDVSWSNATSNVMVDIDQEGKLTLTLNGNIIFNHVQLPSTYCSANRSNWSHAFAGRTGAYTMNVSLDNILIQQATNPSSYYINDTAHLFATQAVFAYGNSTNWSVDDGSGPVALSGTGNTIDYIFTSTGTFTFHASTPDSCGHSCDQSIIITVTNYMAYEDLDGDGYGNSNVSITTNGTIPSGYAALGGDCNDTNSNIHPNATEICNGIDDDCDGLVDEGFTLTTYYQDNDGDGYGNYWITTQSCSATPPIGYVSNSSDCNDNLITYGDNDNDGFGYGAMTPCGVGNNSDCDDNLITYPDSDGDGFPLCCTPIPCGGLPYNGAWDCNDNLITYADMDGDGFGYGPMAACGVTNQMDCNDNLVLYPDADGDGFPAGYPYEPCVGIPFTGSWDCNDNMLNYVDADNDGFGSSTPAPCGANNHLDCDDNLVTYPDADGDGFPVCCAAIPCGGIPYNGAWDCNDAMMTYQDLDGDGFGSNVPAPCGVSNQMDCNDNLLLYPDADGDGFPAGYPYQACVGIPFTGSWDCNDAAITYMDNDGDGYGTNTITPCGATDTTDCNDSNYYVHAILTYYPDADGDGYGDPAVPTLLCGIQSGYVPDNTDCDDQDVNEHPGQVWYTDNDNDGYGTGAYVVQCARPVHGKLLSEMTNINGDCNDNNPLINLGSQYFTFSGSPNFSSSVVYPTSGDPYTNFTFEVMYYDANGGMPQPSFPRLYLDYEGNGVYNNVFDRTVVMQEVDPSDLNTTDGKKYRAVVNQLNNSFSWKAFFKSSQSGCETTFGPFDGPDVLLQPDIEIFANDIQLSSLNPAVSSALTITATIHNVSDYPAVNTVAHLVNQYDTTIAYPDFTVAYIAPHTDATVTWSITTPSVPAWCPMQVFIDYTNVLAESNENDNSAIRPFVNGAFNLPGSIITYYDAQPNPVCIYQTTSYITGTLSGYAYYTGTAIPLADSSCAGATVTMTIAETGATFTGYTNSNGYFSIPYTAPPVAGVYHITGSVTDFTLTGTLTDNFTAVNCYSTYTPCALADLSAHIYIPTNLVAGQAFSATVEVANTNAAYGVAAPPSTLQIQVPGSSQGIYDLSIPTMAPGATYTTSIVIMYPSAGTYSLTLIPDDSAIVPECTENFYYAQANVYPALPDLGVYYGPNNTSYDCQTSSVGFSVINGGGVNSGPFTSTVLVKRNGLYYDTWSFNVPDVGPFGDSYGFTHAFVNPPVGNYTFEVFHDNPNMVAEVTEVNNQGTYSLNILACKPNFGLDFCALDVNASNNQYMVGTNANIQTNLYNTGNLPYSGPLTIRYNLSNGTTYDDVMNVNLTPGAYIPISYTIPLPSASPILSVIVDPNNLVDEQNESDNMVQNTMCWEYQPVMPSCGGQIFWHPYGFNGSINQEAYITVPYVSNNLYDADTLHMMYEVSGPGISGWMNLGTAEAHQIEMTCGCPYGITLPTTFVFSNTGTYTFRFTIDPENRFGECNEGNNVLYYSITISDLPDMRILSQHIAPSMLNPQPGDSISMNVTYENIGRTNLNDVMKMIVKVDNDTLSTIYPLSGILTTTNFTVPIPEHYASNLVGVHVIRAIIDADNQVTESNELNNEATRAFVVGDAANLYFQQFNASNTTPNMYSPITIHSRIGNNGDVDCEADVQFYFVNNNGDSVFIGTHHLVLNNHDSVSFDQSWVVLDNNTTIVGKIVNTNFLEFTYTDNTATLDIGGVGLAAYSTSACGTTGTATASASGGTPPYTYYWSTSQIGNSISAPPGTYTVTVADALNQTNSATVLIGDNNVNASQIVIACDSYTLPWGGTPITASGGFSHTYSGAAANGCDSTSNIALTIAPSEHSLSTATSCGPYTWLLNGQIYSTSGTYVHTSTTQFNCPKLDTLILTVNNPQNTSLTVSACDSYLWTVNNQTYTTSGTYVYTPLTTYCAGTDTLHLNIHSSNVVNQPVANCGPYIWNVNNQTYTSDGSYTASYTDQFGCDSNYVLTLTLTAPPVCQNGGTVNAVCGCDCPPGFTGVHCENAVCNPNTGSSSVSACGSYTWEGVTYMTSGAYTHIYTNVGGCDSVHTLYLTIYSTNGTANTQVSCDQYTWSCNNMNYTTSGTYYCSYVNAQGCTVTDTLNLQVNQSSTNTSNVTVCDSYTWMVNGQVYTNSGTYTHTGTNANGCLHIETLNLFVNSSSMNVTNATACDGYLWMVDGNTYTISGTYTFNSINAFNCPHTEVLNLTINNSTTGTTNVTACDSYTWAANGMTYTTSGTYTSVSTNAQGCVHTSILNLTVNSSTSNTTTATACNSYTWSVNGQIYTSSGTYTSVSTNGGGCAHTEILNLTISIGTPTTQTQTQCGGTYTWSCNGQTYNSSGSYLCGSGCNQATLNLTINPIPVVTAPNVTACTGAAVTLGGTPAGGVWNLPNPYLGSASSYTYSYTSPQGCTASATASIAYTGASVANLQVTQITGVSAVASWAGSGVWFDLRWRPSGSQTWSNIISTNSFSKAIPSGGQSLTPSTTYILQIRGYCTTTTPGAWISTTFVTNSLPSCAVPVLTGATNVTSTKAKINWSHPGAAYYNTRYRKSGAASWISGTNTTLQKSLTGLQSNTQYEYQIQAACTSSNLSTWSPVSSFTTLSSKYAETVTGELNVYPNPTEKDLTVEIYLEHPSMTELRLMDMSGRMVKTILTNAEEGLNKLNISLDEVSSGIYTLHILLDGNLQDVRRVMKQ